MDASGTTRRGGGSDDWLPAAAEMVDGAFKMLTSTKTGLPSEAVWQEALRTVMSGAERALTNRHG